MNGEEYLEKVTGMLSYQIETRHDGIDVHSVKDHKNAHVITVTKVIHT